MLDNVIPLRRGPQLSAEQLAALVRAAGAMVNAGLEILDALVGDPDLEANGDEFEPDGDELDHNGSPEEDEIPFRGSGPGCLLSDDDYGTEEAGEPEVG
jgi:hypothetical protein